MPDWSEYQDPESYDLENPLDEAQAAFYLELARELGGPVLDLGCGTGRFTLELAQAGVEAVGVDLAEPMLARARQKGRGLPVSFVQADVRTLDLGRTFGLILDTGPVLQHLLERPDQEGMLAGVRRHLGPVGRFAVGVWFPKPDGMVVVAEEQPWFSYRDAEGREVRVSGTERYDPVRQVKTETAVRRRVGPDGAGEARVSPLALRWFFPQEFEALLHYNGLEVQGRYGGYDRSPLTPESRLLIYVCGLRGD